ncbi:MAG: hypothetical protein U5M51_17495 [Emticicia sp.]|nr:hypothetical protein [Emticicia sp.]
MSYSKFKMEHLQNKLHLKIRRESWLNLSPVPFDKDTNLEFQLKQAVNMYLGSEKARSEFMIAPVLQAFQRKNADKLSVFSGYELNVDKKLDLNGYCDFIISTNPDSFFLQSPIFCVVEAKKMEPEINDLAQCGAEMYAAKLFHEKEGKPQDVVYGCATSGYSWVFLKLEADTLYIDSNQVPLTFNNPYDVLATLQWVLEQS